MHILNYLTRLKNRRLMRIARMIQAEPIMNAENTKKQLEVNNINDYNSNIRDQNVIIKSK